jgi:hypothetical protein
MHVQTLRLFLIAATVSVPPVILSAQSSRSIPISQIRYDVTFDSTTAESRNIDVAMSFTTDQPGEVLLSLPAWTPGDYEIANFARYVNRFGAIAGRD